MLKYYYPVMYLLYVNARSHANKFLWISTKNKNTIHSGVYFTSLRIRFLDCSLVINPSISTSLNIQPIHLDAFP